MKGNLRTTVHRLLFNNRNLYLILLLNGVCAIIFSLLSYFGLLLSLQTSIPIFFLFVMIVTFTAGGLVSTLVIRVLFERLLTKEFEY